jgi:hypothetical protein
VGAPSSKQLLSRIVILDLMAVTLDAGRGIQDEYTVINNVVTNKNMQ